MLGYDGAIGGKYSINSMQAVVGTSWKECEEFYILSVVGWVITEISSSGLNM